MSSVHTIRSARQRLRSALSPLYGDRESTLIADWVLEADTGKSKEYCRMHTDEILDPPIIALLDKHLDELLRWRPVQYVLGEAWFMGRKFRVDERVLIPRPETEELVLWVKASVMSEHHHPNPTPRVLDIGTGSGCIPISLKAALPMADVWSLDASADALEVARANARMMNAEVHFLHLDVLDDQYKSMIPQVDIIVSNPPYVLDTDRTQMRPNVIEWEPHMALFVDGPDPLLFYHRIAALGLEKLAAGGQIFVEIQETQSDVVVSIFHINGYVDMEARADLSGRDRMVRARKP